MHPFNLSHRDFFGAGRRRTVLIKLPGVGPGNVAVLEAADDDELFASERAADLDLVAGVKGAVRLGRLAVDGDLAALTGFLRLGPRAKQAGHIQPDVQAQLVDHRHNRKCCTSREFCYLVTRLDQLRARISPERAFEAVGSGVSY